MLALIMSVINFLFAAIILVFESVSYRCTREGPLKKPSFCFDIRESLNFCTVISSTTLTTLSTIPHDPFNSGRIVLVILGVLGLLATLLTMLLLSVALKMGKPVYLAVKRHKKSIVVGKKRNAELALTNKLKNLDFIMATALEEERYDKRKTEKYKEYLLWKKYCEPGGSIHLESKELQQTSQKAPSDGSVKSHKSSKKSVQGKTTSTSKSGIALPKSHDKSDKSKTPRSVSPSLSRTSREMQMSMQSPGHSFIHEVSTDDKKKKKKK